VTVQPKVKLVRIEHDSPANLVGGDAVLDPPAPASQGSLADTEVRGGFRDAEAARNGGHGVLPVAGAIPVWWENGITA
jgi:hypothetical protein